jgi:hypothetical protein
VISILHPTSSAKEALLDKDVDPSSVDFIVTGVYNVPGRGPQVRVDGHDHQRRPEPAQGRRQRVIRHGDLSSLAQAAAVADPARHRRSQSALGLAHAAALHPAFVGARKRGSRAALCPSRANAQNGKDLAAEHRRRGHAAPGMGQGSASPRPTALRSRRLPAAIPNFAAWEQTSPTRSLC